MSFLGRIVMRLPSLTRPVLRPTVFARAFAATQVYLLFITIHSHSYLEKM